LVSGDARFTFPGLRRHGAARQRHLVRSLVHD
jgi:hypothetical protein